MALGVEPRERLVEQQQVGPDGEPAGQVHPSAFAAGERAGVPRGEVVGPELAQCLHRAAAALAAWHAPPGLGQVDVRADRPPGQPRGLQHRGDPALTADRAARRDHPSDRLEQRALARTVGAEQGHHLARGDGQGDVADDLASAARHA